MVVRARRRQGIGNRVGMKSEEEAHACRTSAGPSTSPVWNALQPVVTLLKKSSRARKRAQFVLGNGRCLSQVEVWRLINGDARALAVEPAQVLESGQPSDIRDRGAMIQLSR